MTYSVEDLASAKRLGFLLRVDSATPIRLWSGQVRDLAVPAGGAEPTEGAIYQSHGQLGTLPQIAAALNGEAARMEFAMSGAAITGAIAALATDSAAEIRNVANDVGVLLFDAEWQIIGTPFWLWSGTSDSLTVERSGSAEAPTRTIKLSAGNVFTARKQANLSFYTDIDQRRRSSDDAFCDQVARYYDGTTIVWGIS